MSRFYTEQIENISSLTANPSTTIDHFILSGSASQKKRNDSKQTLLYPTDHSEEPTNEYSHYFKNLFRSSSITTEPFERERESESYEPNSDRSSILFFEFITSPKLHFTREDKNGFKKTFLHLIKESTFEYGYSSQAEEFFKNSINILGPLAREWTNELYIENIKNEGIIIGILRVISHLPYDELYPVGMTIATAALAHRSNLVKENGIRAFENWEDPRSIPLLESMECNDESLRNYLNQVILDLKEH